MPSGAATPRASEVTSESPATTTGESNALTPTGGDMAAPRPAHTGVMEEFTTAYTSSLSITFGPQPASVVPWETPTSTDADDDLRELRRRVVEPLVAATFTSAEYSSILVYRYQGEFDEIGVRVETIDEPFLLPLTSTEWALVPLDPNAMAERLASALEDWVCESSFGWGQQRIVHPVVLD